MGKPDSCAVCAPTGRFIRLAEVNSPAVTPSLPSSLNVRPPRISRTGRHRLDGMYTSAIYVSGG
jgi:hypothetical protein